jgi:hypothetical protein
MKNQMLFALGACFSLTTTVVYAQKDHATKRKLVNAVLNDVEILKDTLIFIPDPQTKVLYIGDNLKQMTAYKKLDSLKFLLISDLEEARKDASFPVDSKMTYYFVHPNGKRRLKAESADYMEQEVNIAKEKQSLDLDLPPYGYIIYDLSTNYQCQIFVKQPEQISTLKNINFNECLTVVAANRRLQYKNFRLDLEKTQQGWSIKDKYGVKRNSSVILLPTIGIGLIGSRWSPELGVELMYMHNNKHAVPNFKTGLAWSMYTFTDFKDGKLSDLALISSTDFKFLWYVTPKRGSRSKWGGFQIGLLNDKTRDWLSDHYSVQDGPLQHAFKFGISFEGIGPFNFSIDQITAKNCVFYGATIKIAF